MAEPRPPLSSNRSSGSTSLHSPAWQKQSRTLRREGSILRFKLGTKTPTPAPQSTHNPPSLFRPIEYRVNRNDEDEEIFQNNNFNLVLLPRPREFYQIPRLCAQIGGLRGDPFRMLPIEQQGFVSSAFDYYATIFLPSATRYATLGIDFRAIYLQTLLQEPLRFEAIIAFALAIQSPQFPRDSRMSKALLYHSNRATATLHQRLLSGTDTISDEVVHTISILYGVALYTGNPEAFEPHVRALKQIVAARGGIGNIKSLRGFVQMAVNQVFSAWKAHQKMLEYKRHLALSGDIDSKLSYPAHPFPPHLCRKISRFSSGFQNLATSRKLSIQFINFFSLTVFSGRSSSEEAGALSTTVGEVLGILELTTLERLLGIALTTYSIYAERNLRTSIPSFFSYIQSQFRALTERPDLLSCDRDALEWACLIFIATTKESTDSWQWADGRLRVMRISERRQRELGQAFLPIPQGADVVELS